MQWIVRSVPISASAFYRRDEPTSKLGSIIWYQAGLVFFMAFTLFLDFSCFQKHFFYNNNNLIKVRLLLFPFKELNIYKSFQAIFFFDYPYLVWYSKCLIVVTFKYSIKSFVKVKFWWPHWIVWVSEGLFAVDCHFYKIYKIVHVEKMVHNVSIQFTSRVCNIWDFNLEKECQRRKQRRAPPWKFWN